jgi:hypothetical protein
MNKVMLAPSYDLRACSLAVVEELCAKHHGYGAASATKTYAFAVYEDGKPIAAFAWQPPPVGAAKSVCPEAPSGVLALSRMVAVDRSERKLAHISRPLRRQMRVIIDRGRWPVLVTYHDEGQGHTGHVYKCNGWARAKRSPERRAFYVDETGARQSRYSNGVTGSRELILGGYTRVHRWEHWACEHGQAALWMNKHGWRREPVPNKVWASGNPAYRWVHTP